MELDELSPDDPRAYVRLAALLRDGIASGEWKPGKPAPSITVLSQQYGHARPTCSKAMRLLVEKKLLVRVPGLGYHVRSDARERLRGLG